jgi:hypothetical protein
MAINNGWRYRHQRRLKWRCQPENKSALHRRGGGMAAYGVSINQRENVAGGKASGSENGG